LATTQIVATKKEGRTHRASIIQIGELTLACYRTMNYLLQKDPN
jgi:hypothetical protein